MALFFTVLKFACIYAIKLPFTLIHVPKKCQGEKKLEGVFRNIDFNSEGNLGKTRDRNTRLQSLLEDFANPRLDLRPSHIGNLDVIGNAYDYLIARFAS